MAKTEDENKQKKAKAETMVWFRCSISAWKDRKLEALTVPERWFLFQLHIEMVERAQPIGDAVVDFLARDQRIRPSTAKSIVEKLVQNGFVYRIGDCLWSNPAEEEYAFRQERTAHKTASNRLAAQKRWEKDKQNQRNAMREEEGDNMGAAHRADAHRDSSLAVNIGGDKEISQSECSPRLSASHSEIGEEDEALSSEVETTIPDDQTKDGHDIAVVVPRHVARMIDLSKVTDEPTEQTVRPLAEKIASVTGFDLDDVIRFTEETLWAGLRDNDASSRPVADEYDEAIPF